MNRWQCLLFHCHHSVTTMHLFLAERKWCTAYCWPGDYIGVPRRSKSFQTQSGMQSSAVNKPYKTWTRTHWFAHNSGNWNEEDYRTRTTNANLMPILSTILESELTHSIARKQTQPFPQSLCTWTIYSTWTKWIRMKNIWLRTNKWMNDWIMLRQHTQSACP